MVNTKLKTDVKSHTHASQITQIMYFVAIAKSSNKFTNKVAKIK